MENWCLLLLLAVLSNRALGDTFNHKYLTDSDDSNTDKNLEDRFGWHKPISQGKPDQKGRWFGVYLFPLQQLPGQWQELGPMPGQDPRLWPGHSDGRTSTPSPNENGSTTQSSSVRDCIRTCPVTSEYNPVCGSDGVTYTNPGRLGCAQACGVNVKLLRASRCPAE